MTNTPGNAEEPVTPSTGASAGLTTQQYQHQAGPGAPHPMPAGAPSASRRVGLAVGAGLLVLVAAIGATLWAVGGDEPDTTSGPAAATPAASAGTSAPAATAQTTSTPAQPKPLAVAGDCAVLSGTVFQPEYQPVDCAENKHNYTVSKTPPVDGECGTEGYLRFTKPDDGAAVCMIPVFADGECYDFALAGMRLGFAKKACGGFMVVKAKALDGADIAACTQKNEKVSAAMAFPEIDTTYCLYDTLKITR